MNFSNKDFVHFHCHSDRSHFDGLAKLSDLVLTARKMGFPAIAITDHGNIMSWIDFLKKCKETKDKKGNDIPYAPIKPILGCEFYLSRTMNVGQYESKGKKNSKAKELQPDGRKGNRHLNLFCMNFKGYQNLCTLSQRSWTEGFYSDPRIDVELLAQYSEGLMCGSACLASLINFNLLNNNYKGAKNICGIFKEMFENNFFLEVMYHGIPEQRAIIADIFKLSKELDIPVIATNDVHYIRKDEALSQEVLMCMSTSRCLKDPKRISHLYGEFYLKSADEMAKLFGKNPECLTNSVMMAERINTADIENNLFGGMRLPVFDVPDGYKDSYDYLCKLAWDGLKKVGWNDSSKHVEALKKELEDIRVAKENNNYDFAKYFLIVMDYVNAACEMGTFIGCGRGSGYASVLLRCLGITYGIDPLEEGREFLWERFLGFDELRFIKNDDFGFAKVGQTSGGSEFYQDREVEDDLGGVDRY
jgi:DNA polymerase III subunit alpha